ncbi:MAG: hypothetical protein ACFFCZ_12790 [Promethearchaeota archaeon]
MVREVKAVICVKVSTKAINSLLSVCFWVNWHRKIKETRKGLLTALEARKPPVPMNRLY